jgi:hypothetical protein
MLLNEAVSDSRLRSGLFFIPRLDRLDTSDSLPFTMIMFV